MAATTDQLTALSQDAYFRQRVRNLAMIVAASVMAEVTSPAHSQRVAYAVKVIQSPGSADVIADFLCGRANLTGSTVTYDFGRRAVVTDATDLAIQGQIQNDWSFLAGVPTN